MISIEEARKLIPNNDSMSDQEVETAINNLQLLAELVFDHWNEEKNKNAKK